ncbi:hypothetical protein EJ03DRAFT_373541 [Teratosphaeria nubilosa]|uniref:Uncharacterized protein n=1 Tax=Teratosphaeria nubilosa TaxID=161662 RepID=A0A6G1LDH4_9PEZI|nr:hypothetical protein EJ03DRAFT_373541 [Teratosphaeria nubilosa]
MRGSRKEMATTAGTHRAIPGHMLPHVCAPTLTLLPPSLPDYTPLPRSPAPDLLRSPRSPDTASPIYPERAIRPLPRSRLKSKLSPEQASGIVYPPDPPALSPTLQFDPDDDKRRIHPMDGHRLPSHVHCQDQNRAPYSEGQRPDVDEHCTCGGHHDHGGPDSGDEEIEFDHPDYRYPPSSATPTPAAGGHTMGLAPVNGFKVPLDSVQRRLLEASRAGMKPPPPGSAASSADGYESFENTSNKKKRKIPLSSAGLGQSQLSAEIASMAISPHDGAMDDPPGAGASLPPQHFVPLASGTGISGAGRGRYGRQNGYGRNGERRPVGNVAAVANGHGPRLPNGADANGDSSASDNTGGIISQAIKSAAEQGPLTPSKTTAAGKENGSLLQSATDSMKPPTTATPRTQFTFSCESESATKMELQHKQHAQAVAANQARQEAYRPQASAGYGAGTPGAYPATLPADRNARANHANSAARSTQGTQTTPTLRQGQNPQQRPPPPPNGQQPPPPKPKPRRRPSKEYALAAQNRRIQQEYTNYHHRPTKDNMWICEFCEYEDIFGEPPVAMIRRYEIKDRQERKKAAERRRLLEKAKMKGRKGKKGSGKGKGNANQAAANPPPAPAGGAGQAQYDPNLPPPEGEEYYDDEEEYEEGEYGDEYDPVGGDPGDAGAYYPPPGTPAQGVGPPPPPPPPPQAQHQHQHRASA